IATKIPAPIIEPSPIATASTVPRRRANRPSVVGAALTRAPRRQAREALGGPVPAQVAGGPVPAQVHRDHGSMNLPLGDVAEDGEPDRPAEEACAAAVVRCR